MTTRVFTKLTKEEEMMTRELTKLTKAEEMTTRVPRQAAAMQAPKVLLPALPLPARAP